MTIKTPGKSRNSKRKGDKKKLTNSITDSARRKIDIIRGGHDPDSRDDKGQLNSLKSFERDRRVSEEIITDLEEQGKFFCEDELAYYLDFRTRKLIDLGRGAIDLESLLSRYGLNPTEKLFKYVIAEMFLHAINHGAKTHIHHFSHLSIHDDKEPTLYIACEDNHILRITGESHEVVDNGTDDVLFLTSKYTAPGNIPPEFVCNKGLIRSLILGKVPFDTEVLSSKKAELMLLAEMLALLMREAIPDTKPIFAFIGEKGSGKTTAVRMIGQTLYGPEWDVDDIMSNLRDFDTLITTNEFVCFDNVDDNIKWLNNKLAVAASGGNISRQKLYETHRLLRYPIISMIATTSRTPCFRRDDVADRLVILRTVRFEKQNSAEFNPDVLHAVKSKHCELWGELIFLIQGVLRLMRDTDWKSIRVPNQRLQGFARLTVLIAKVLDCESTAYKAWESMKSAQLKFASEEEPLFEVMPQWIADNAGREVTSGELNAQLKQTAAKMDFKWPYSGGRSLGQKLSQLRESLTEMFDVNERECPIRKQRVYSFWPKGKRPESNQPDGEFPG